MKKVMFAVVAAAMIAACVFGLMACGGQEKVKMIDIKLSEEEYAFGVNKSDTELLNQVNDILKTKEDEIDAIMNKFFSDGEPSLIESAKKDDSKDQLVVATETGFEPFEYKVGNKFAGIDMEIAKLIADTLGKELVIEEMEFDSVVTSVQNGTCDIAMAGLTVDADRAKMVNFSNTYYQAGQVLIVASDNTDFDECKTKADVDKVLASKAMKVGYQSGTTGQYYVTGEKPDLFDGFKNLTGLGFTTAGLATLDMINGNIDVVIVDGAPAKAIVKSMNK